MIKQATLIGTSWFLIAVLSCCTMPGEGASTATATASPLPLTLTVGSQQEKTRSASLTPSISIPASPTTVPEPVQIIPRATQTLLSPTPTAGTGPDTTRSSSPTPSISAPAPPTTIPELTRTALCPTLAPTSLPQTSTIRLFEELDMVPGQTARLESTDIEITLVQVRGPPEGCFDCPNSATLDVRQGEQVQTLSYSFSGNMVFGLLQRAKRKTAFSYIFVARKIDHESFTLQVEPESG